MDILASSLSHDGAHAGAFLAIHTHTPSSGSSYSKPPPRLATHLPDTHTQHHPRALLPSHYASLTICAPLCTLSHPAAATSPIILAPCLLWYSRTFLSFTVLAPCLPGHLPIRSNPTGVTPGHCRACTVSPPCYLCILMDSLLSSNSHSRSY